MIQWEIGFIFMLQKRIEIFPFIIFNEVDVSVFKQEVFYSEIENQSIPETDTALKGSDWNKSVFTIR